MRERKKSRKVRRKDREKLGMNIPLIWVFLDSEDSLNGRAREAFGPSNYVLNWVSAQPFKELFISRIKYSHFVRKKI